MRILTGRKIREHTVNLAKMRRAKSFKSVRGGCVSVEITNEGNGWHVHSHWLLDADWLDMPAVSQSWAKLVGQQFAICKVKDVRGADYLQEVTKYVVEGSELAKWPAEHINEFVRAVKGRRFFFPFGTLFKLQPEIRKAINAEAPAKLPCQCGCEDFIFRDEIAEIIAELKRGGRDPWREHGKPSSVQQKSSSGSLHNGVLSIVCPSAGNTNSFGPR
jgi:hypothetical protein